jgi:hypothetical protein
MAVLIGGVAHIALYHFAGSLVFAAIPVWDA